MLDVVHDLTAITMARGRARLVRICLSSLILGTCHTLALVHLHINFRMLALADTRSSMHMACINLQPEVHILAIVHSPTSSAMARTRPRLEEYLKIPAHSRILTATARIGKVALERSVITRLRPSTSHI